MDNNIQLKELFPAIQSQRIAVIYCDGEQEAIITYCDFYVLSDKLGSEVKRVLPEIRDKSLCIGLFSDPSLYLPVVVHALINLSATFVPLKFDDDDASLVSFIKRCGLKYMFVPCSTIDTFKIVLSNHSMTFEVHKLVGFYSKFVIFKLTDLYCVDMNYHEISFVVQSSGSTGFPKIINVPTSCIIPNLYDLKSIFSLSPEDVILIPSALTFDASLVQMFLAWMAGSTMVVISKRLHLNSSCLTKALLSTGVTVLQCTPSFLNLIGMQMIQGTLLHQDSKLRILALGGERFPKKDLLRVFFNRKIEIFNIYGTSEVSSWASIHKLVSSDFDYKPQLLNSDWVPLGCPLSKTRMEIWDDDYKSLIDGVGNIWIGGKERMCIIDRDDSKAKSLLPMRYSGDLAEVKDGRVYFLGRSDDKVKRNGQLVDLNSLHVVVEGKFEQCCCIILYSKVTEKDELWLFVKHPRSTPSYAIFENEVLLLIRENLSPLHIPEHIVSVESFKVNPHGKIDKEHLKDYCSVRKGNPKSSKIILADGWKAALGFPLDFNIDDYDNFVSSGGESFTAIYYLNYITKHLNLKPSSVNYDHLLDMILKGTFKELEDYVCNVGTENTQVSKACTLITKVDQGRSSHPLIKCCHFISFQKQSINLDCGCLPASIPNEPFTCTAKDSLAVVPNWIYNLGKCIDASPLIIFNNVFPDGIVFIGSHSHAMAAITLHTGTIVWKATLDDRIESSATICYHGTLVSVGCYDGYIYFLQVANGTLYWKFDAGGTVKSSPVTDRYNSRIIYVGSHGKCISAVDVGIKICLWKVNCNGSSFASPLINYECNSIYLALLSGELLCIKKYNGGVLWKKSLPKPIFSSPCLCQQNLVVACVDFFLYGISPSGTILWKFESLGPIFSSPICVGTVCPTENIVKEFILFGSNDQFLYCLNDSGMLVWKFKTNSSIYASPAVLGQTSRANMNEVKAKKRKLGIDTQTPLIISVSTKGMLNILNIENGSLLGTFSFPGEVFSSPVIAKDLIVVGCRDDNVYSLKVVTKDN